MAEARSQSTQGDKEYFPFSILILGQHGPVGISEIIAALKPFSSSALPGSIPPGNAAKTRNPDFDVTPIVLQVDNATVKWQVWNIGVSRPEHEPTADIFKHKHIILLGFNSSNSATWEDVEKWRVQVNRTKDEDRQVAILQNTIDDTEQKQIFPDDVERYRNAKSLPLHKINSTDPETITKLFLDLSRMLITRQASGQGKARRNSGAELPSSAEKHVNIPPPKTESFCILL